MSLNPLSSRLSGLRPRLVPGLLLPMTQASSAALPRESLLRNVQCVLFPVSCVAVLQPRKHEWVSSQPWFPLPSCRVHASLFLCDCDRQIKTDQSILLCGRDCLPSHLPSTESLHFMALLTPVAPAHTPACSAAVA